MKKIFSGRKKFFTVPFAFLIGLFFFPLTIVFLIGWFTKSKIANSKIKLVVYSILGIIALPFASAYAIAFTTSTKEPVRPSPTTVATSQPTLQPLATSQPIASTNPTNSPTPIPTIKPTLTGYSNFVRTGSLLCGGVTSFTDISTGQTLHPLNGHQLVLGCVSQIELGIGQGRDNINNWTLTYRLN